MPEETPNEAPPAEEAAPASEAPQEATPSTGSYVSREDHVAELKALETKIWDRMKQSQKDVIKASVSSEVGEKLSGFDEVVELLRPHLPEDLDVQGIKRGAFIDKLMAQSPSPEPELEQSSPPQEEVPEPAGLPTGREAEIAQILEAHSLDNAAPELLEYAEANKNEPWWKIGAGFEKLASEIATRKAGTPAGVVATQGQAANPDLVQEFRKELNVLLNPVDSEGKAMLGQRRNMSQLRALQQKHRELGVSEEDLDVNPVGGVPKGNTIHDWAPPA